MGQTLTQNGSCQNLLFCSEVWIYKRKHAFDQESEQEKKKEKGRKHALDQESDQEKKEKT